MIAFLLLAASTTIFDETVTIPRAQWRGMRLDVKETPATIEVSHEVLAGKSGVRVVLMTKEELERFERGRSHDALSSTGFSSKGKFSYYLTTPGDYRVLLNNTLEGRTPAEVRIRIRLTPQPLPRTLPVSTRRAVVVWSLLGFCTVGGASGWKLLSAIRSRRSRERHPPFV